jgi:uncharacterized protein (DUF2141 family)
MMKILFCLFPLFFFSNTQSNLKVVVKGIQTEKGNIVVEVFNSKGTFLKKSIHLKTIKAKGKSIDCSFELPEGHYAITAYHDINSNKILDKTFIGLPNEPYGLSNNFRPTISVPTFDDCKVKVENQTTITVRLK